MLSTSPVEGLVVFSGGKAIGGIQVTLAAAILFLKIYEVIDGYLFQCSTGFQLLSRRRRRVCV